MGVVNYSVKYVGGNVDFTKAAVDSLLNEFNNSLSTYVPDSEISELNNQSSVTFRSPFFYPVLQSSAKVFKDTEGAFDPTVGPLVNQWGFGPEGITNIPDSLTVDSLMVLTGFEKIVFDSIMAKMNAGMYLDFSAIAKGYAVDLVSEYLLDQGIKNFMVEIGGELRCAGYKEKNKQWTIGIEDPTVAIEARKIAAKVNFSDLAMATSGNYRNFYVKDGKKYAHTISPFTGYPVEHSLLSASVFAPDCMSSDAYATAFMVMGLEKSIEIIEQNTQLEGHLIYSDSKGEMQSYTSAGIKDKFIQ